MSKPVQDVSRPPLTQVLNTLPSPLTVSLVGLGPVLGRVRRLLEILSWKSSWEESWLALSCWWVGCLCSDIALRYGLPIVVCGLIVALRWIHPVDPSLPTDEDTLHQAIVDLTIIRQLLPGLPQNTVPSNNLTLLVVVRTVAVIYVPYLLLTYAIRLRILVAIAGTILFTWRARWALLIRRALWRSAYIRWGTYHLWSRMTGLPLPSRIVPPGETPSIATAEKSKNGPANTLRFLFTAYENQRWWMGLDFTAALLPGERPSWCSSNQQPTSLTTAMTFTDFLPQFSGSQLSQLSTLYYGLAAATFLVVAGILYYIVPYLRDSKGLQQYPGPWLAKYSCLWFSHEIYAARVQSSIKQLHERYGTFVRIGPNDVSVCSTDALQTTYAHSLNAMKSEFYQAFAPFGAARSVFNTTSREDHARKRKLMSHMMAAKSLLEVTPIIYEHERKFVKHWDEICDSAAKGEGGTKGDCTWKANEGRAWFNVMPWFNYIAFDVIGDLAFGAPFGMLPKVKAETPVAQSAEQAMNTFASSKTVNSIRYQTINAIECINGSSAFGSFLGSLPLAIRPHIMSLPMFKQGFRARRSLSSMAVTAVSRRINSEKPVLRRDFLSKLLEGRDENGLPMGKQELSSEALSLLIGGSDTVANSSAAIVYYLGQNPTIQHNLQVALDAALGPPDFSLSAEYAIADTNLTKLKDCNYLTNVINEGLRLHSTVGFGLPRVVPEGGMVVGGQVFKEGTIISTPVFALHMMKEVWGEDAELFNPERWEKEDKTEMYRAFAPFSIGPRACLGRNLAMMEIQTFIGTIFHRYDIALESPDQKLMVHESFIRKPDSVYIGIKQRKVSPV